MGQGALSLAGAGGAHEIKNIAVRQLSGDSRNYFSIKQNEVLRSYRVDGRRGFAANIPSIGKLRDCILTVAKEKWYGQGCDDEFFAAPWQRAIVLKNTRRQTSETDNGQFFALSLSGGRVNI